MPKEFLAPLPVGFASLSLSHWTEVARTRVSVRISGFNAELGNNWRMKMAADVEGWEVQKQPCYVESHIWDSLPFGRETNNPPVLS